MLFDFPATSEFELSVSGNGRDFADTHGSIYNTLFTEGMFVRIQEGEDGSGWVKVANNLGGKGLVPASYVEIVDSADIQQSTAASQGSGKYGKFIISPLLSKHLTHSAVQGIYEYQAQGPDELSIGQGELIELTAGPTGGQDYGDGWWEGWYI